MKYLILGSSGQIGSELAVFLKEKQHIVIEFDLIRSPLEDLRIENNVILLEHLKNVDFIYFLAYQIGGSRYLKKFENTFEFISNNSKIMLYSFELLKLSGKPFIFASSQMSNMSFSTYGTLKLIGEKLTNSLNGVNVKMWNIYGLESDYSKSHVITDFILQAKYHKSINLLTNGNEKRQFLYVKDCCECLYILSNVYDKIDRDKELHITSFKWEKIIDIARIVSEIYPSTSINPSNDIDNIQYGKKNIPNKNILKYWEPKTSLKSGIRYLAHRYEIEMQ